MIQKACPDAVPAIDDTLEGLHARIKAKEEENRKLTDNVSQLRIMLQSRTGDPISGSVPGTANDGYIRQKWLQLEGSLFRFIQDQCDERRNINTQRWSSSEPVIAMFHTMRLVPSDKLIQNMLSNRKHSKNLVIATIWRVLYYEVFRVSDESRSSKQLWAGAWAERAASLSEFTSIKRVNDTFLTIFT